MQAAEASGARDARDLLNFAWPSWCTLLAVACCAVARYRGLQGTRLRLAAGGCEQSGEAGPHRAELGACMYRVAAAGGGRRPLTRLSAALLAMCIFWYIGFEVNSLSIQPEPLAVWTSEFT